MEEVKIQKDLRDFRCFKEQFNQLYFMALDPKGYLTYDAILNPDQIFVMADNPYQLNIAIQKKDNHGTIYHLYEDAEMEIDIDRASEGCVYFKDRDHHLIFHFNEEDWKNADI